MKRPQFNEIVARRTQLINEVLAKKGQEYSGDNDVFHNFKNSVGISFHKVPEKVAWEFMTKHLMSIKDMLDKVEKPGATPPTQELIEEKIGDAINYLILIEGMLKERREDTKDPLEI